MRHCALAREEGRIFPAQCREGFCPGHRANKCVSCASGGGAGWAGLEFSLTFHHAAHHCLEPIYFIFI